MAMRIDLTFDTRDAESLAEFWKLALGYEDEPSPAPFTTRDEWVASLGEEPDDGGGGALLHDPDGVGPRLVLLDVPEQKVAKNRLHIDVHVGKGPASWERILAKVSELVPAGGRVLATFAGHHVRWTLRCPLAKRTRPTSPVPPSASHSCCNTSVGIVRCLAVLISRWCRGRASAATGWSHRLEGCCFGVREWRARDGGRFRRRVVGRPELVG